MKHTNHIDFFSSPTSKFLGFSDIRQPQQDIHPNDCHDDYPQEEKKTPRKSSFNYVFESIMPFGQDFFDQKLEECEESSSYSQQQQLNDFIAETQYKTPSPITKLSKIQPKSTSFQETTCKIKQEEADMFSYSEEDRFQSQGKATPDDQQFLTPKRKSEFPYSKRFYESTADKSIARNNEKGLRRLSSLAYSIVSHSPATTYKEVAEKLLSHLNFDSTELDDEECRAERSSMQNVKRRVYDSLNVLIALGVIKRVGNKITRQKQKQPFLAGQYSDLDRYNDLRNEYEKRSINVDTKRKTEKQLKQKLQIFKRTVERNKKTKNICKSKIIRLPFLVFAQKTNEGTIKQNRVQNQKVLRRIKWVSKNSSQNVEKEKKKSMNKRNQGNLVQLADKSNDMIVQVNFKGYPQSFGDLDIFRLIQQKSWFQNDNIDESDNESDESLEKQQGNNQVIKEERSHVEPNHAMMNLIDEVFEHH